jgi:hypothetical protein
MVAKPRLTALVLALFLLALLPRLYSALTVGSDWYGPGSYTVINFDEVNACRAWLDAEDGYSRLLGAQTVTLASLLGTPPPADAVGNYRLAKAYCLQPGHMRVARSLSAVMGAATVAILAVMGLILAPSRPQVGLAAGLLLALSGFHAIQSHMATVDVAMTFYTYGFILGLMLLAGSRRRWGLALSTVFLLPALYAKRLWPFPLLGYLAFIPTSTWHWLTGRMRPRDLALVSVAALVAAALAFNTGFQAQGWLPLLGLFYLFVPWRRLNPWTVPLFVALPWGLWGITLMDEYFVRAYTSGWPTGRFGAHFGAIGWNKIDRNLLNLPLVVIVGIGLPAAVLIPMGIKRASGDRRNLRLWLCFLPVIAWALYMLLIAPRTTYRHYLPLFPLACLLAAYGLYAVRLARNRLFLLAFFLWPALLQLDMQLDFHRDTRQQAVEWYRAHPGARVFATFFAAPPPDHRPPYQLFREEYAMGEAAALQQGDYLVLSENWYETAQRQELNGLRTWHLDRLVKTTPEKALLYRQILAGEHPNLALEREYRVQNFMPELVLHKGFYGTFQKFLGDLRIYRIEGSG